MASASVCNELNFAPDFLPMTGLRVGFTYAFEIVFKDRVTKDPITITGDDFEMVIKDSAGGVVETLTTTPAVGLTINVDTLTGLISTDTTQTAGKYTYLIAWTIAATSAVVPAVEGTIIVK